MKPVHGVLGSAVFALHAAVASAQPTTELAQVERDLDTAVAEIQRIESAPSEVPELFSIADRDERATWGAIYHLNKEYARASLALYGAVQPRPGENVAAFEATQQYAESLYFLADALYELGNIGASRVYFERLLALRGHEFHDEAILRLMAIASSHGRFDDVDRYYTDYLAVAGTSAPGQVRYLRAKSLFQAKRDDDALAELARIPTGEAFDLRARYLRVAMLTRQDKLNDALLVVDDLLKLKPVAVADREVKEVAILARARLLYELDRLTESIDAYQDIEFGSKHLITMLYEVTLTYVRRGQIALHGTKTDGLTDAARRANAKVEYKKALRQLEDLRALDPNGLRSADIELLAGSLKLQLLEFDGAEQTFGDVVSRYRAADGELATLAADLSVRELVLKDILALEADENAPLSSPLPAIAARRAAQNKDVARSLAVFKDLRRSRAEVDEAQATMQLLDDMLSPSNPSRTESFAVLQSAVGRSVSLANTVASLRTRTIAVERAIARPSPEASARLKTLAAERGDIEKRIGTLPTTSDEVAARKTRFKDRLDGADRAIHELELVNDRLRAGLAASEWLVQRELADAPATREAARAKVRQLATDVAGNQAQIDSVKASVARLRREVQTAGGRGSGEESLRAQLEQTLASEREVLAMSRDPSQAALTARVDALNATIDSVASRNRAFRDSLDGAVEGRLVGARAAISQEREALARDREALDALDQKAASLRDQATGVALDRVRRDISRIVLRADVGTIDTAFARKQAQTEQIGAFERARAAELTDLTQAYADLTRDDLP